VINTIIRVGVVALLVSASAIFGFFAIDYDIAVLINSNCRSGAVSAIFAVGAIFTIGAVCTVGTYCLILRLDSVYYPISIGADLYCWTYAILAVSTGNSLLALWACASDK